MKSSVICAPLSISALVLFLMAAAPAAADSLRCNGRLLKTGDRMYEVRKACGEPDVRVPLYPVYTLEFGVVPLHEEWQYNFGPQRLLHFVRFQNGRLTVVHTGPYGFREVDNNTRCNPYELQQGLSTLELLARCGEPAVIERRIAQHSYRLGKAGPFYPAGTPVEDWIYDFGSKYFDRIVTVIDGRVLRVESNARGGD
jgi:hypothetical protein